MKRKREKYRKKRVRGGEKSVSEDQIYELDPWWFLGFIRRLLYCGRKKKGQSGRHRK